MLDRTDTMVDILYFYHMIKKFLEWINLKEKLHKKDTSPPLVNEGEIWWTSLGENIGREINGKSRKFSRPVIIFRKLSREIYLIIPTTTKQKHGTWYVPFRHRSVDEIACLQQIRTVDHHRLLSKMGQIDKLDFIRIQDGFKNLYTKNVPHPV